MHIVGNSMPVPGSYRSASQLSVKQRLLRRKVFSRSLTSPNVELRGKEVKNDVNPYYKDPTMEIFIPTASASVQACGKPPVPSSTQPRDKGIPDVTDFPENTYYIDIVDCDGRLKMEHVENPRPLPPRHSVAADTDSDNSEMCINMRDPGKPNSVYDRRCVTDSELRPSRRLLREQVANFSCSSLNDRPSLQLSQCGDAERTFYRVCAGFSESPNTFGNRRTAVFSNDTALERCSLDGQKAPMGTSKHGEREPQLRKAVSSVDEKVLYDVRQLPGQSYPGEQPCLPHSYSCDCIDDSSVAYVSKYFSGI